MYLVDTNVISELRQHRRTDRNVLAWSVAIREEEMFLSAITLQEIAVGILRLERRDPPQAAPLRQWFDEFLRPSFQARILSVDEPVAMRSAALQVPDPRSYRDVLIAATAIEHNMIVVTRNVSDFLPTGVRILNPFDANPKVISA